MTIAEKQKTIAEQIKLIQFLRQNPRITEDHLESVTKTLERLISELSGIR